MKKKSIKLLVVLACVLMALGMAGCGKKAYKTFPEKYKLASVDVGGMTACRREVSSHSWNRRRRISNAYYCIL